MKQVAFFLFLFFGFPIFVWAYSAQSMVAMDMDSKRILYAQNMNEEKLIASTTKIMTTIVALEQMDINTAITIDERVLKAYGSAIYVEVGEVMSLKDLLYGLMLRSGNDAAIVIANAVGGSMEGFADLMNRKAYEIGMEHTIFYNAHGLEESSGKGNTSTAYDMALLMSYAMDNEVFCEITSTKTYVAKSNQKTYHWTNKNKLLNTYEYTIGGKTGFTEKARRTLVTAAEKEGRRITIVTLNDGNDFADHKNLYEVLFSKMELVSVFKKDAFSVPDLEQYQKDTLYIEKDVDVLLSKEEKKDLHVSFEIYDLKEYETGDTVGLAHIMLKDEEIMQVKIYVEKKQNQKEGFLKRFFRWFFRW